MCCIIAHRSPPVDQQNSASIVESDQPEDPAVGTKIAWMMPGSMIILPSSDVEEYSGIALCSTISRILIIGGSNNIEFLWAGCVCTYFFVGLRGLSNKKVYNCPNWWPKDVVFSGI